LTDSTVTLGEADLAVSSITFDAETVSVTRSDWDEDALDTVQRQFLDADVRTLTVELPERRFEFPVQAPTVRRCLDRDGATVTLCFETLETAPSRCYIGVESDAT